MPHVLFKCWYKYMKQFKKNIVNEFWIIQPNQLKFNPINPNLELGWVPRIRGWARFSYQPTQPHKLPPPIYGIKYLLWVTQPIFFPPNPTSCCPLFMTQYLLLS